MHIIIDFDSTLSDTHYAVLKLYREITGDYGTEIDDNNLIWNMKDVCRKWSQEEVDNTFINPRLFGFITLYPNVKEILNLLQKDGHTLEICSMHKTQGIPYKAKWIKDNLGFIDAVTILPLDNGFQKFDKSSVHGDIIIDDRPDALRTSPCRHKICFGDYSWNKNWDGEFRANNWIDVYAIISEIIDTEGKN